MKDRRAPALTNPPTASPRGPVELDDATGGLDNSEMQDLLAQAGASAMPAPEALLLPVWEAERRALDEVRSAGEAARERAALGFEEAVLYLGVAPAPENTPSTFIQADDSPERVTAPPETAPAARREDPPGTVGAEHLAWQSTEVEAVIAGRVEDAERGVRAEVETAERLAEEQVGGEAPLTSRDGIDPSAALLTEEIARAITEGSEQIDGSLELAGVGAQELAEASSSLVAEEGLAATQDGESARSGLWAGSQGALQYTAGAGLQLLSSELGGALDGWLDGFASDAFHHGRGLGDAAALVLGAAETAFGLMELAGAATITAGGGAVAAGSGGLLALPAAGIVVAVDAIALSTGLALTGHGALVLMASSDGLRNGRGDTGPKPAPETPAAFPDATPARRKTPVKGGGGLRKRWTDKDGNILEWDSQHGAIEKYDRRGRHLGEFDPNTGQQTKAADKSRRVEP